MENNFKREITFENKKIRELVEKKLELVVAGREVNEEAMKIAEQHSELVKKIEKTAEKIREIQVKIIHELKKIEKTLDIEEFELPLTTDIKEGILILEVENVLEAFKKKFVSNDKFLDVPVKKGK
jgi:hypothetical protein